MMFSDLPIELVELIECKTNMLLFDDVMDEMKRKQNGDTELLKLLEFDELHLEMLGSDPSVQRQENFLLKTVEYELEAECPEVIRMIDVMLIKEIDRHEWFITDADIGLNVETTINDIIRDAFAQNGLEYHDEGMKDAIRILMSL
jgi:hypothetical protein